MLWDTWIYQNWRYLDRYPSKAKVASAEDWPASGAVKNGRTQEEKAGPDKSEGKTIDPEKETQRQPARPATINESFVPSLGVGISGARVGTGDHVPGTKGVTATEVERRRGGSNNKV